MFMNTIQEINDNELKDFKVRVKQWLEIDEEIKKMENKIKEIKKIKK